jgi:hypothetical protein
MSNLSRWFLVAVVGFGVGLASPVFAQQDAHIGTWKQNFEKSKVDPAPTAPRPQSITRTYEKFGDGLKFTQVTVSADGTSTTGTYSAHYDGKDYPLTGNANADTISLKRIDASTFDSTLKKAGKIVTTGRNTVSADGKTMTYTSKGTNASGQPFTATAIFDRQ